MSCGDKTTNVFILISQTLNRPTAPPPQPTIINTPKQGVTQYNITYSRVYNKNDTPDTRVYSKEYTTAPTVNTTNIQQK